MTTKIKISFKDYLSEVYDKPDKIHESFSLFHEFSWNNRILSESQLIFPMPINTYKGWLALGRQVKKGSKTIKLLMPVRVKSKNSSKDEEEEEKKLSQHSLKNPIGLTCRKLKEKNLRFQQFQILTSKWHFKILESNKKNLFQSLDGNCLGYAKPNLKIIAASPLSPDPN